MQMTNSYREESPAFYSIVTMHLFKICKLMCLSSSQVMVNGIHTHIGERAFEVPTSNLLVVMCKLKACLYILYINYIGMLHCYAVQGQTRWLHQ